MNLKRLAHRTIFAYMTRFGLIQCAIALETETLDDVPETQRNWYVKDATSAKYKLDPAKVEIEDTSKLKTSLQAAREEAKAAKQRVDAAVAEALKQFEGIDPVKTRELIQKFENDGEAALIRDGKIDQVIEQRLTKKSTAMEKLVEAANQRAEKSDGLLKRYQSRVLDNEVRAAAAAAGVHAGAVEDALFRARAQFKLNDEDKAVQFEEDGSTVKLGPDGKNPFSLVDWFTEMKEKAPHWFPAGNSGNGANGGNRQAAGGKTVTRGQFDAMGHDARAKFAKEGGIVV